MECERLCSKKLIDENLKIKVAKFMLICKKLCHIYIIKVRGKLINHECLCANGRQNGDLKDDFYEKLENTI